MLKQDWFAAAEDEIHPRVYPSGTVLTGEMLTRATALGLVIDVATMADAAPQDVPQIDVTTMADAAPEDEHKALDAAPENKAGRKK